MLGGGGARAAYQVGVLEAIADIRKAAGAQNQSNAFPIITGTSAGAINAAALACGADDFDGAVRRIVDTMSSIFLDSLAVDIERMRRINQTMSLVPPEARSARRRKSAPSSAGAKAQPAYR